MAKFEVVSKYNGQDIHLPTRATSYSAGYDFEVAEDTIIPTIDNYQILMREYRGDDYEPKSLDWISDMTKRLKLRPTLVPTGIKCKMADDEYLEITVRSSLPLKSWLILANSQGIIDSDYYNCKDCEGAIFFQLINLSPFDIILHKGDRIGQGIIHKYITTEDDVASGARTGGFGSTT